MSEELFYEVRENEWYKDRETNAYVKDERIYNFETKKEALQYFLKSVGEYHGRFDFWKSIEWSDENVWTTHYFEEGDNECILEKWEGFDDEVEFGWYYNGEIYRTKEELAKAYPNDFSDAEVWTHHNYCFLQDNKSKEIAGLSIKYKEEYD